MTADLHKCMDLIRAAKQDAPHMDRVMRALEKIYNLPPEEHPQSTIASLRLTEAYSLLLLTLDDLPPEDDRNRGLVIAAMRAVSSAKDSLCHPVVDAAETKEKTPDPAD
ncbi:MAG TPA: hypothetical protein VN611_08005 [Patescibacteria group bacterium]|nr:hypothetical protein [Patescibacteria group bacterium]